MDNISFDHLWLVVIAMGIVTYLPRMLPMVLLQKVKLPPFINRFLGFVPFAVLGALIFPGILFSTGNIPSAIFGGIISIIIALLDVNLILVVLGGILSVFVWQVLIQ
ncbi:hypothetical protein H0A61_02755 [Koleobacter methoxysyntrophicus]|uniref:Branched-chain amino acid transport protein (AzlD) n=1 Tax=Koleobacter methoxysyntrophicus TaxID=2751313 RepID=A0A8A0RS42_9FIRM|nr:AzlD domain-containing protein [Koleobacter methoxysyntrophicus]QSQ10350.1 hypothetical protein H0A61_02755 [Koleobacter methoxysyntrophicus]